MAKSFRKGHAGAAVVRLQENLIALGYRLPRFGADGTLDEETLAAAALFRAERMLLADPDDVPGVVPAGIVAALEAEMAAQSAISRPGDYVDARGQHPRSGLSKSHPHRAWKQITGITLHQTASLIGERETSWFGVPAHLGITRAGRVIQLYNFTDRVNHGRDLDGGDIGIEIDGYFEGVEGNNATLWRPPAEPGRKPLQPTGEQIEAARQSVHWIRETVKAFGGRLRYVHAHRQSSKDHQSDPGSRIWHDVGVWAQAKLGLSDGGKDFAIGRGLPIPEAWDPRHSGVRY